MSKSDITNKPVEKDNEVKEELRAEAWDTLRKAADTDSSGNLTYKSAKSKQ